MLIPDSLTIPSLYPKNTPPQTKNKWIGICQLEKERNQHLGKMSSLGITTVLCISLVLNWGWLCPPPPWGHLQCLKTFLAVTTEQGLLASGWWREGMLLSTSHCTGWPPPPTAKNDLAPNIKSACTGCWRDRERTAYKILVSSIQALLGGSCSQVVGFDLPHLGSQSIRTEWDNPGDL